MRRNGSGTITFDPADDMKPGYMMLWPHVRPWRMGRVQPAFRSIPDAQAVDGLFAQAAEARLSTPRVVRHAGPETVAAE